MAPNRLLAIVIVIATVLFTIGISIESGEESEESPAHVEAEVDEASEELEAEEAHEERESALAETEETSEAHEDSEELLGVDVESTPLVVLAVIVSLALAAGAWLRPDVGPLLLVVGAAMIAFAVLDVREVFHQVDEDRSGLALLAGAVALLHVAAAALAWRVGAGEVKPGRPEKIGA